MKMTALWLEFFLHTGKSGAQILLVSQLRCQIVWDNVWGSAFPWEAVVGPLPPFRTWCARKARHGNKLRG